MGKVDLRAGVVWGALFVSLTAGCSGGGGATEDTGVGTLDGGVAPDPAALVQVHVTGVVGVLLTDIPEGDLRDRVAEEVLGRPEEFWIERVRTLLSATEGRLMSRTAVTDRDEPKRPLPLPPRKQWTFEINPSERLEVEGHDVVSAVYKMEGYLLTDLDSVGLAEPALAEVGGTHVEAFVLPVDPELLFSRTHFACVREPLSDVRWSDHTILNYFDDRCRASDEGPVSCHRTGTTQVSCEEALRRDVGSTPTEVWFERIPWDRALADEVRSSVRTPAEGADLALLDDALERHRVEYRYFESTSCAVESGCVGGAGWRRLLLFDTEVFNGGGEALVAGNPDSPELAAQNLFVTDACHAHPHHALFADVILGEGEGVASDLGRSACLTSRRRYINHESAPLSHDFATCDHQGLEAGWGMGDSATLDCQWLDVTGVDSFEGPLSFRVNPAAILCEGLPELDDSGQVSFEPSGRTNELGEPVGQPLCTFRAGHDANNAGTALATVPPPGHGLITEPCGEGAPSALQDCGFTLQPEAPTCVPGEVLRLQCLAEDGRAMPRVLRLCEYSQALGSAIPCLAGDAIRNLIVNDDEPVEVSLRCPEARGSEPGGRFAIYDRSFFERDTYSPIHCTLP